MHQPYFVTRAIFLPARARPPLTPALAIGHPLHGQVTLRCHGPAFAMMKPVLLSLLGAASANKLALTPPM
jgi:hypothetical protein